MEFSWYSEEIKIIGKYPPPEIPGENRKDTFIKTNWNEDYILEQL